MNDDWHSIFNERGLLLAIFGALGGAVRSAALKTTWRDGVRVVFIGSGSSFGFGVLGPHILKPWLGDIPDGIGPGALGTLCAAAFMIGLIAVTIIERFMAVRPIAAKNGEEDRNGKS